MIRLSRTAGFTLIEVLIAMTLLSVMVLLLFGSLKIGADSWERGEHKTANVNDIGITYNFFQSYLASAIPLFKHPDEDNRALSFQGQAQRLEFVSTFPASLNRGGLQLFSIYPVQDAEGSHIKVNVSPFDPDSEDVAEQQNPDNEVDLISGVASFDLEYWQGESGEGNWEDQWQDRDFMPRLVKIKIGLTNGSFWPDMIISLRVTGNPDSQDSDSIDAPGNADDDDDNDSQ